MPPAAILDVDGTLVDTNYQHAIVWAATSWSADTTWDCEAAKPAGALDETPLAAS